MTSVVNILVTKNSNKTIVMPLFIRNMVKVTLEGKNLIPLDMSVF